MSLSHHDRERAAVGLQGAKLSPTTVKPKIAALLLPHWQCFRALQVP